MINIFCEWSYHSYHSEILVYDWAEEGDSEIVVEDIERIPFEYDIKSRMCSDWLNKAKQNWIDQRYL